MFGAGPGGFALKDPSRDQWNFSLSSQPMPLRGVRGSFCTRATTTRWPRIAGLKVRNTINFLQNTTFGSIQGFTRKPATPFTDDAGNFAGIVHQERNITYALFAGTGHLVLALVPEAAFVFVREFVLGTNATGLVDSATGTVIGGEEPGLLNGDVLPGGTVIYYGSGADGTTSLSAVVPSATLASWEAFVVSATATGAGTGTPIEMSGV